MIGCSAGRSCAVTVGRLHAGHDIGAHRQRHIAVAPPQDRLFEPVGDFGQLRQRHRRARGQQHRQIAQARRVGTFVFRRADDDVDQFRPLAVLA